MYRGKSEKQSRKAWTLTSQASLIHERAEELLNSRRRRLARIVKDDDAPALERLVRLEELAVFEVPGTVRATAAR